MVGNYLIGLREGLEAVLVVSILISYLVRLRHADAADTHDHVARSRHQVRLVWRGVAAAVALSLVAGAVLTFGSAEMSFEAQEVFGGVMSVLAVALVTWMIFWMRRTAATIKADLEGKLSAAMEMSDVAVVGVAFLAVAREGLETALFFWSAARTAGSTLPPLAGFALGLGTAVVLGWLLYRRAVTINLQRFFVWTGAALIVVAAGVLAYGVHDLQEGGVLGGIDNKAFDITSWFDPTSWYATLLKGTINFQPDPTVLQVIAWAAYLVPTSLAFALHRSSARRTSAPPVDNSAADAPAAPGAPDAPAAPAPTAIPATPVGRSANPGSPGPSTPPSATGRLAPQGTR